MAYKCIICGVNEVDQPDEMCELCALGQDPYLSAMQNNQHITYSNDLNTYVPHSGKSRKILIGAKTYDDISENSDVLQNQQDNSVKVYQPGQAPTVRSSASLQVSSPPIQKNVVNVGNKLPVSTGIIKNVVVDKQGQFGLVKIFKTLFTGIPYTIDDDITMFQVFPDFTGTTLNPLGNACDQVIVYGKVNTGYIAENNDVEIYGYRDSRNNVIAKRIVNKASGINVTPERTIPALAIWAILLIVTALVVWFIGFLGIKGIIWSIIIILCLTHIPLIFKILAVILGFIFSLFRRRK